MARKRCQDFELQVAMANGVTIQVDLLLILERAKYLVVLPSALLSSSRVLESSLASCSAWVASGETPTTGCGTCHRLALDPASCFETQDS